MKHTEIVWESNLPEAMKVAFDAQWISLAQKTDFDNLNEIQQDYIVQWFEHSIKTALEAA